MEVGTAIISLDKYVKYIACEVAVHKRRCIGYGSDGYNNGRTFYIVDTDKEIQEMVERVNALEIKLRESQESVEKIRKECYLLARNLKEAHETPKRKGWFK